MSATIASPYRRPRVALARLGRKGASLVETGLLVALIALVSIGAVAMAGHKVETIFCQAAYKLGAYVACQDFAPGGEEDGDAEVGVPGGLTARMIDSIADFSNGDDVLTFAVGGLDAGRAFNWEVLDRTGVLLASGSGEREGVENLIEVTLGGGAPGSGQVRIFATLASGLPATHSLPFSIIAADVPFLPPTLTVIDGEIAAGAEDDGVVFEVGGLQPGYPFDWRSATRTATSSPPAPARATTRTAPSCVFWSATPRRAKRRSWSQWSCPTAACSRRPGASRSS